MKKPRFALILILAGSAWAAENPVRGQAWRYAVGFGGGYEAGNGLHLGLARGSHAARMGLGLFYLDETAEFQYSAGLRYLRTLYTGRINDTYAWMGSGIRGHSRKGDAGFFPAAGAGVGLSLHFGLPFHLQVESGWDGYFDSANRGWGIQWGPTLNGALVYEWR